LNQEGYGEFGLGYVIILKHGHFHTRNINYDYS
jgi:hypothetical protein